MTSPNAEKVEDAVRRSRLSGRLAAFYHVFLFNDRVNNGLFLPKHRVSYRLPIAIGWLMISVGTH